jgi:hypothetical protein
LVNGKQHRYHIALTEASLAGKPHALPSITVWVAQMPESSDLLTIGEIAARARHLAKDPFAFAERCRHWSRLGLLVAVENVGEGAGRHALFRESEAFMAAAVNAFAEAGLPPAGSQLVADAQSHARHALADWLGRPQSMRLEINVYPGGGSDIEVVRSAGQKKLTAEQAASLKARGVDPARRPMTTITLDLGLLFASVAEASGKR